MQVGVTSPFNISYAWLAEGLTSTEASAWPRLQQCTWRYGASMQRSDSAIRIFFRQNKSPVLLACPVSHFHIGTECCSAHVSYTTKTQGPLPPGVPFLGSKVSSLKKLLHKIFCTRLPLFCFRRSQP